MSENQASFCAATSRPVRQEAPFVRHFLFRKQDHCIAPTGPHGPSGLAGTQYWEKKIQRKDEVLTERMATDKQLTCHDSRATTTGLPHVRHMSAK